MVVTVLRPGTVQPVETLKVLLSSVLQGTNATGKAKTSKNENKKKTKKNNIARIITLYALPSVSTMKACS